MISNLKELYGINIDYYEDKEDGILFFINNNFYYFIHTDLNEKYVIDSFYLSNKYNRIPFHSFVLNKNGNLIEKGYVLFKINTLLCDINYNDLIQYNKEIINENKFDMISYWEDKLDYIEQRIWSIDNYIIIEYFDYYLGIAEMLLQFLKRVDSGDNRIYLTHKVFNSLSPLDFYNPLNITFDNRERDLASYIRIKKEYNLIKEELEKRLNKYEYYYLFVRMCFPFSYFDSIIQYLEKGTRMIDNNPDEYENYLLEMEEIFNIRIFYFIKKVTI